MTDAHTSYLVTKRSGWNKVFVIKIVLIIFIGICAAGNVFASKLKAGVAKVNITNTEAGPVNDSLFVKALIIDNGNIRAVIITVDAVAIAEIGSIRNDYLNNVRSALKKELNIMPANVMINASHCHGKVCSDIEQRTIQAVKKASENLFPVTVGTGTGYEDRIMENRRFRLKDGREADSRRAYSLPPDKEIVGIGPVDPEIGILRLDKKNGETLAVIYNFACHPIQGVPGGGNTADITGFASAIIENYLNNGAIALFLQGCAGDINPVMYKDVNFPPDALPLGQMLALSTLEAIQKIECKNTGDFKIINESIKLPRADLSHRIDSMQAEQARLLHSLKGTSINLKTFVPLVVKYNFYPEFPSYYSHRYLNEKLMGKDDLNWQDSINRKNIETYVRNIYIMEELTRNQINLELLKKHHARNEAYGERTITVEIAGLRIGDFVLVSFPGELSAQIGLNIKKKSPYEHTFIAGYTNGYIYYAPTAEQLNNTGGAQEDSDCMLAAGWQKLYETKVMEILNRLVF